MIVTVGDRKCGGCGHPQDGHKHNRHECMYEPDCPCMTFEMPSPSTDESAYLDAGQIVWETTTLP